MRILFILSLLIFFCLPLDSWVGCNNTNEVTLSGTGYNNVVLGGSLCCPLVFETTCICKVFYTSSSGGNPTVNTLTIGYSNDALCQSGITELLQAGGITGVDTDFGGAMRGTAGANICVKEAVANSDKITITYQYVKSF